MDKFIVLAFDSTHDSIKSESIIKENKIENARLIPLPPEVSAGCGLALRILEDDFEKVNELFSKSDLEYNGAFLLTKEDGKRSVVKLNV